jgi:hypothetical protein
MGQITETLKVWKRNGTWRNSSVVDKNMMFDLADQVRKDDFRANLFTKKLSKPGEFNPL